MPSHWKLGLLHRGFVRGGVRGETTSSAASGLYYLLVISFWVGAGRVRGSHDMHSLPLSQSFKGPLFGLIM